MRGIAISGFHFPEGIFSQVNTVGVVGGKNYIIAIEMFDYAVILQGYHPAGILVHTVINNKQGMAHAKRRINKYRGI